MALTIAILKTKGELVGTLTRVFGDMQTHPELIRPSLLSFVDFYVPLFMRGCIVLCGRANLSLKTFPNVPKARRQRSPDCMQPRWTRR